MSDEISSIRAYFVVLPIAVGLCLGPIFLGLKLVHIIDWPWWLITSPVWVSFANYYVFTERANEVKE